MSLNYEGVTIADTLTVGPKGHILMSGIGQLLTDNGTQTVVLNAPVSSLTESIISGQILTTDSTAGLKWNSIAGNNSSTTGVPVYASTGYTTATGTTLNFNTISPASSKITVTQGTDTVDIDVDPTNIPINTVGTPTANVNMGGTYTITNLPTPVNSSDAANKGYVDSTATGLDVKLSCYVASTGDFSTMGINVTAETSTTITGTLTTSGSFTVDGITLTATNNNNTRILLKNISASPLSSAYNGIYTFNISSTTVIFTRTSDFDSSSNILPGSFTFIEAGTKNVATGWILVTQSPIAVGTTNLDFTQFSATGVLTAGDGINITGNQISVNALSSALINASAASLKFNSGTTSGYPLLSSGTTTTEPTYGQLSLTSATGAVTGILPVTNGGTGSSSFTTNTVVQVGTNGNLISTNINPSNIQTIISSTVNTTSSNVASTPATLFTISNNSTNSSNMYEFNIVAIGTDSASVTAGYGGGWNYKSIFVNIGGTVTKLGESKIYNSKDATWGVQTVVSGTSPQNILVQVYQNSTSTQTVDWYGTYTITSTN